jgi:hypothetical protein
MVQNMIAVKGTNDMPGEGILLMGINGDKLAGESPCDGKMSSQDLVAEGYGLVRGM